MEEEFTLGDLITHGTFMLSDDADKTVWLTRDGDAMYITTDWKNVNALLEDNARAAAEFNASGSLGELQRVASIPVGLYQKWTADGITEDPIALARRLNDADFSKFRTNSLKV